MMGVLPTVLRNQPFLLCIFIRFDVKLILSFFLICGTVNTRVDI